MKLFEEGVKLTESLRNHLESAEQRIKVLMKDTEGNLKTEDFKD
jgi:exodeoxyribonuclease VII small subunit